MKNKDRKNNEILRQVISGIVVLSMILTVFGTTLAVRNVTAAGGVATTGLVAATPHYFGPWPNYANSPLPTGAITGIMADTGGAFYTAPIVTISDLYGLGTGATADAIVVGGVITGFTITNGGSGYSAPKVEITDSTGTGATATASLGGTLAGGIRKFVDSLPGLGPTGANNLGQYLVVAVPDTTTYPGCDYYEIGLIQHTEKMHSDLPPTLLNSYVQISTAVVPGLQVPLTYLDGSPILGTNGTQVYGVDNPHYLGPSIVSVRDRPVRIKFTNYLPAGMGGDLFLPVDTTVMGAGMGPHMLMPMHTHYHPGNLTVTIHNMEPHNLGIGSMIQLEGFTPDAYNGMFRVVAVTSNVSFQITLNTDPGDEATVIGTITEMYTENRATLHLHGGATPWISDGTPHQWTTPAGEVTGYPKGVSVEYVPDMWFVNGSVIPNTVGQVTPPVADASNNPGDGSLTFYYTNQQSARLMFYHDHAYGLTRLNVYSGEAAGYIVTDQVEQDLIAGTDVSGVNPGHLQILPDIGIPLVIQDKSFVDPTTIGYQDPTWIWGSTPGTPHAGDLWLPHVYMPNQNAYAVDGSNGFGRWDYGPWFWPPTSNIAHPAIPNPYYEPNNPQEPPFIPAAPNPSMAMEAFMDTSTVNGVAYPYLNVEPKAYRFRILSAGNDRTLNLQMYVADPNVVTWDGRTNTEVKMVPACSGCPCNPVFPPTWPNDGRAGGVPDPTTMGPSFIQIGTEGGFLPKPAIVNNQPVTWNLNAKTFNFGNVLDHALLLGPAERADVIIDFSQFAGQTIILYNDAPAAFPAYDPRYDYFTGCPDNTDSGGAPTTQPGYGPNTRTIMQIRVNNTAAAAPYDLAALNDAFAKNTTKRGVFEVSQDPIIIPQAEYNSAYDKSFPDDTFVRISDMSKTFQTISGNTLTLPFQEKAIHDEMGAAFDEFGRVSGFLGLEIPNTQPQNQNFLLYGYASPPVDIVTDCITPSEPLLGDGTQIWRVTHNGIDTHLMHFHLFNVQLINRVGWDNMVLPPDLNELGWKDTVRMNPLESCIVALRPISQTLPFEIPNSIRLIDPTMPEGEILSGGPWGFTDPSGEPVTVTNHLINFGWEYVWHCHILGHEEMDMMHTLNLAVAPRAPTNLTLTIQFSGGIRSMKLDWLDNSISETGYTIQRAEDTGFTIGLTEFSVGADITTYTDIGVDPSKIYFYRVQAINVVGDTFVYPTPSIGFPTATAGSAFTNVVTFTNPVITTLTLPDGEASVAYNQTFTAASGTPPYSNWVKTLGTFPAGLTLDANTGVLSGTPSSTSPGTYSFTIQVTDSLGGTGAKAFSLTIVKHVVITTASPLPRGEINIPYTLSFTAAAGVAPYTGWTRIAGAFPPGLTLNPTTGVLSGTPTATGTYSFTIRVTDSLGGTATKVFALTIVPPPTIITNNLPNGRVGIPYSTTLVAVNGISPYTWARIAGNLPPGLSLNPTTGVISGTPTTVGLYPFTIRVTDSVGGTGTRAFTIRINP